MYVPSLSGPLKALMPVRSFSQQDVLGYNQQTLTSLGVAKDIGDNVGLIAGFLSDLVPPAVVLVAGSCLVSYHWLIAAPLWHALSSLLPAMCLLAWTSATGLCMSSAYTSFTCIHLLLPLSLLNFLLIAESHRLRWAVADPQWEIFVAGFLAGTAPLRGSMGSGTAAVR